MHCVSVFDPSSCFFLECKIFGYLEHSDALTALERVCPFERVCSKGIFSLEWVRVEVLVVVAAVEKVGFTFKRIIL